MQFEVDFAEVCCDFVVEARNESYFSAMITAGKHLPQIDIKCAYISDVYLNVQRTGHDIGQIWVVCQFVQSAVHSRDIAHI